MIKEKDNNQSNLKLFKENILKKFDSINDDYKEVFLESNKGNAKFP